MTSYPTTARSWERRKQEYMRPRDWIFAALVVVTIIALAWLTGYLPT